MAWGELSITPSRRGKWVWKSEPIPVTIARTPSPLRELLDTFPHFLPLCL